MAMKHRGILIAFALFLLNGQSAVALSCDESKTKYTANCVTNMGLSAARFCRAEAEDRGCPDATASGTAESAKPNSATPQRGPVVSPSMVPPPATRQDGPGVRQEQRAKKNAPAPSPSSLEVGETLHRLCSANTQGSFVLNNILPCSIVFNEPKRAAREAARLRSDTCRIVAAQCASSRRQSMIEISEALRCESTESFCR